MKLRWRDREQETGAPGLPADFQMPKAQQSATLVMPDGVHLPARIAGNEGADLLVLAMVRLGGDLTPDRLQQVALEISGGKGVIRLGGDVAWKMENSCASRTCTRSTWCRGASTYA